MKKLSERAEIYLKAARSIANGEQEYSCNAVRDCGNRDERLVYADIASPEPNRELLIIDIEEAVDYDGPEAARSFRVLLLCMMAAACDDLEMEVKMKKAKAKPRSKPIVLRFTYAQAHALSAVLRYVGGNPEPGDPRYLIDEIQHMLRQGREFDYTVFEVTRPHYSSGLHIARR